MKKVLLTLCAVGGLVAGCGDDSGGGPQDLTPQNTLVPVSGVTIDIDLLAGTYFMMPNISAPDLLAVAAVKNTPVYGLYVDGTKTDTVMADATGAFTIMAKAGSTLHMVAAKNAALNVLNTWTAEETKVGTTATMGTPAHVCTTNPYAAPAGVAAVTSLSGDQIADAGVCMFGNNDHFTPPFVKLQATNVTTTTAGFKVYAMTNPAPNPVPTFVEQGDSPIGIHAIFKAGNTTETMTALHSTSIMGGTLTYPDTNCTIKPGFVTFMPQDPSN